MKKTLLGTLAAALMSTMAYAGNVDDVSFRGIDGTVVVVDFTYTPDPQTVIQTHEVVIEGKDWLDVDTMLAFFNQFVEEGAVFSTPHTAVQMVGDNEWNIGNIDDNGEPNFINVTVDNDYVAYILYTEMEEDTFYFQTETTIVGATEKAQLRWNLKNGKRSLIDANGDKFNVSELVDTTKAERKKIKAKLVAMFSI